MVVFPSLPLQGPGTMGKSQVQVNIRWLIYWCGHGGEGKHGTGGLRHTQTLKIAHLPCKTRDGTSFKWWQHPFSQMKTRPDGRLALGKAPDQVPEAQATRAKKLCRNLQGARPGTHLTEAGTSSRCPWKCLGSTRLWLSGPSNSRVFPGANLTGSQAGLHCVSTVGPAAFGAAPEI